jgi:hypothetical protein
MAHPWPPQPRIRRALNDDGHTAKWLSEQTRISTVTVSGIITGRVRATERSRDLISIALRRPQDELFEDLPDEPETVDDDLDAFVPARWETLPPFDDETIDRLRRLLFPQHARTTTKATVTR